jgi:hypothetical protein
VPVGGWPLYQTPPLTNIDYNWHIFTVIMRGNYWAACYQDGKLITEGAPASGNAYQYPNIILMGGASNYGQYTSMDMAEWLIFDRPLFAFERNAVERYLQDKFALSSSLPAPLPEIPACTRTSPDTANTLVLDDCEARYSPCCGVQLGGYLMNTPPYFVQTSGGMATHDQVTVGTALMRVNVSDPDPPTTLGGTLVYSMTGSAAAMNLFLIDSSGVIRVKNSLAGGGVVNGVSPGVHTLTVSVVDGVGDAAPANAVVTISISPAYYIPK